MVVVPLLFVFVLQPVERLHLFIFLLNFFMLFYEFHQIVLAENVTFKFASLLIFLNGKSLRPCLLSEMLLLFLYILFIFLSILFMNEQQLLPVHFTVPLLIFINLFPVLGHPIFAFLFTLHFAHFLFLPGLTILIVVVGSIL